jgi:hypothetical protein
LNAKDVALAFAGQVNANMAEALLAQLREAKNAIADAKAKGRAMSAEARAFDRGHALRTARAAAVELAKDSGDWLHEFQQTAQRMKARTLEEPALSSHAHFSGQLQRLSRAWADVVYEQADLEALARRTD